MADDTSGMRFIRAGDGNGRIDAGPGDDLIKVDPLFQAGRSEITFGAGSDRLEAVFGTTAEYVEGQVPTVWQGFGTHVIRDFTRGEDRMVSVELVDAQLYDRPLGFAELDTSGDGRIDGADAEVTVTAEGLSIDFAAMAERVYEVRVDGPASLRLDGITFLDQSDFLAQPTDGDDIITGSTGDDRIDGGAGDDVLDGGRGDDALSGGPGNDRILGGAGDDTIAGGPDDDFLDGVTGRDEIRGDEGDDVLQGVGRLIGGSGDDVIRAGAGESRVEAGVGDDRIEFSAEAGVASAVDIELGAGRDRLLVVAQAYYTDPERWENWSEPTSSPPPPENWHAIGSVVVHDFTRGEDTLSGITDGYGRTISFAELDGNGDGRIDAADPGVELDDGALRIDLASVAKEAFGLSEVQGPSTLRLLHIGALEAGDFADHPSADDDELAGSSGNDLIHGLDGDDRIAGGLGDDRLFGDAGDDLLEGGEGADTLDGGLGNDTLQGDAGADRLLGGAGDDVLVVLGSDLLDGGAGDDVVRVESIRGAQNVTITLGAGADTFELQGSRGGGEDLTFPGFGSLVVRDFTHGEDLFGRISLSNGTTLGLAELDNNGDGVIDGGDRGVVLQDDGLLIDIAALARFHHADRFDPLGPSTLLLDGIQELTVDDFMRRPTEGGDEIVATSAADMLRLGGGDDVVHGAEGDDVLMGEAGDDRLFGEAGNDVLAGGAGDDLLSGGSGANRLMGGDGSDFLEGSGQPGASGDFMAGGAGNDRIQGSRGNDVIQGGD
ncbi:MAG TPA: calcium-binding protein, partial [Geminicoccus sp.]|uniref:calcium-binding protein n=1 Tax=Geminicoccus sp. TaxID=2024832 RepID=UPI002BAF32A9